MLKQANPHRAEAHKTLEDELVYNRGIPGE
jgi:hypothetical protein